jgi:hypothetical protein
MSKNPLQYFLNTFNVCDADTVVSVWSLQGWEESASDAQRNVSAFFVMVGRIGKPKGLPLLAFSRSANLVSPDHLFCSGLSGSFKNGESHVQNTHPKTHKNTPYKRKEQTSATQAHNHQRTRRFAIAICRLSGRKSIRQAYAHHDTDAKGHTPSRSSITHTRGVATVRHNRMVAATGRVA